MLEIDKNTLLTELTSLINICNNDGDINHVFNIYNLFLYIYKYKKNIVEKLDNKSLVTLKLKFLEFKDYNILEIKHFNMLNNELYQYFKNYN